MGLADIPKGGLPRWHYYGLKVINMNSSSSHPDRCRRVRGSYKTRSGFALAEAMIAVMILGFSSAGISMLLTASMQQNYLSEKYMLASNLAQDLLDEIMGQPFYDPDTPAILTPGPDAGESTRQTFDNVDDYHGLTESAQGLQLPSGSALNSPRIANFSRTATAQYVYMPGQDTQADPTFILVTVQVLEDSEPITELKCLIGSVVGEAY